MTTIDLRRTQQREFAIYPRLLGGSAAVITFEEEKPEIHIEETLFSFRKRAETT
jgi:hypothetical protein